jgi:hypothetical protein
MQPYVMDQPERLEFLSAVEERNKEARLIIKDAD